MAALLSSMLDRPDKVSEYIAECREMGITLLKPDINRSTANFSVEGENIRYGLAAAKGVGSGFIEDVVMERSRKGEYRGLPDFIERCPGSDRRTLESLIKCGAFDGFNVYRSRMMGALEALLRGASDSRRRNIDGQLDLFTALDGGGTRLASVSGAHDGGAQYVYPEISEYPAAELAEQEREVTGMYLSGHPADAYRDTARAVGASRISAIMSDCMREEGPSRYADGSEVTILGSVSSVKTKLTKNNSLMAYVSVDDGTGTMESLVFQRVLDGASGYLTVGTVITLRGKLSQRDDKQPQILADAIEPAAHMTATVRQYRESDGTGCRAAGARKLYLRFPSETSPEWEHMQKVIRFFPGKDTIIAVFSDTGRKVSAQGVIHEALAAEAQETLGSENVASA